METLLETSMGDVAPNPSRGTVSMDVWRFIREGERQTNFIRRAHGRPAGQVLDEVRTKLGKAGYDYLALGGSFRFDEEIPEHHSVACYVVTGGSEGHYVHVDIMVPNGRGLVARNLMLLKTFEGDRKAWGHARKIANLLGA